MKKFKIVFMDGKEEEIEASKFITACVLAAYTRLQSGAQTAKELIVNEKACSFVIPAEAGIQNKIMEWIKVEDKLPGDDRPVLAYYKNCLDEGRIVRANYITKFTIESECDDDSFDYCEESDTCYAKEGWYEFNEHEDCHWMIDEKVTHWMYLPKSPEKI